MSRPTNTKAILVTVSGSQQRDLYHPLCFTEMSHGEMHAAWLLSKGTVDGVNFREVKESGHCVFCHRPLSSTPPNLLEGLSRTLPNGGLTWIK